MHHRLEYSLTVCALAYTANATSVNWILLTYILARGDRRSDVKRQEPGTCTCSLFSEQGPRQLGYIRLKEGYCVPNFPLLARKSQTTFNHPWCQRTVRYKSILVLSPSPSHNAPENLEQVPGIRSCSQSSLCDGFTTNSFCGVAVGVPVGRPPQSPTYEAASSELLFKCKMTKTLHELEEGHMVPSQHGSSMSAHAMGRA